MSIRPTQAPLNVATFYHSSFKLSPRLSTGIPNGQRTWAVVIGINEYKDSPLTFARTDALHFNDYLVENGVPQNHITLLLDNGSTRKFLDGTELEAKAATREGILEALYGLCRKEVRENDTIIIYYAGHGSSYSAINCWRSTRESIEAIAPVDRGGDLLVPDISDREINLILRYISRTKGRNITVILDCCHAAGMCRNLSSMTNSRARNTRGVDYGDSLQRMLLMADDMGKKRGAWKQGEAVAHPDEWKPPISSRMFIAACGRDQKALEIPKLKGGVFTTALLFVLKEQPLESTSYCKLLEHIREYIAERKYRQVPAIDGKDEESLVFQISEKMLNTAGQKRKRDEPNEPWGKKAKFGPKFRAARRQKNAKYRKIYTGGNKHNWVKENRQLGNQR